MKLIFLVAELALEVIKVEGSNAMILNYIVFIHSEQKPLNTGNPVATILQCDVYHMKPIPNRTPQGLQGLELSIEISKFEARQCTVLLAHIQSPPKKERTRMIIIMES